jgi:phosphate transport system substrate-binding protein
MAYSDPIDFTACFLGKRMNRCFFFACLFIYSLISPSCSTQKDEIPQTATSGDLHVAVDAGFWPIMIEEKTIFEYHYKYATLHYLKTGQEEAIRLFLLNSTKFIVTARPLNTNEIAHLKSKAVYPKTYLFARDGLLLLTNRHSRDSSFTFSQLQEIALGKNKDKQLIFDKNTGAGLFSFVQLLNLKKSNLAGIFSADSVEGIIDYVSKNENAIGVLGSSWFSELDSKKVTTWLEKLTIASASLDGKNFYQPFQSEIADSLYPLARQIYLISRESQMSLPNGYASFLLGEKGQRIVLKSGLLPARIPSREVVLSKKSF